MNTLERAKQLAAERDMTLYDLAKQCGAHYNTLKIAETRGSQLHVDMIERICFALDITLPQFFDEHFSLRPSPNKKNTTVKPKKKEEDGPLPLSGVAFFDRYLELIFTKDDLWHRFLPYIRQSSPYGGKEYYETHREPESIDYWRQMIRSLGGGYPVTLFTAMAFELLAYERLGHDLEKELRYAKVTITKQRKRLELMETYGKDKKLYGELRYGGMK